MDHISAHKVIIRSNYISWHRQDLSHMISDDQHAWKTDDSLCAACRLDDMMEDHRQARLKTASALDMRTWVYEENNNLAT